MNQLFCTAPVNLNLLESSLKKKTLITSGLHILYGILLFVSVSVATFWQHEHFDTSIGFLTTVLYISEYVIGMISSFIIITSSCFQRKTYKVFFKRLINVDLCLQKCGVQPNFDSTRKFLRRYIITFTLYFSVVITVDKLSHPDSFMIRSLVYSIPSCFSTLALMQFGMVLRCIQDKMKNINTLLERLTVNNWLRTDRMLLILRKQHLELSVLVDVLCRYFGLLIILTVLVAYVALLSQFYELYKMSIGKDNVYSWLFAYTTLWVILHCGKIILVVYPTSNFSDERKQTGYLLYKIDSTEIVSSARTLKMLKSFSNQLLHETSPPNAMRIINLDMTIVGTMLGVITTYLIILIQFDTTDRDNEDKIQTRSVFNCTNVP